MGALLFLSGCKQAPSATKRLPSTADIVGTWRYHSDQPKAIVTIQFNSDGTFHQEVAPANGSAKLIQQGNWDLDRQYIGVVSPLVVSVQGKWAAMESVWIVIDSTQSPGKLSIFGGVIPDPDAYEEFTPIPNSP